ncbi:sugar ABC transporter ATP-binding protein [Dactylosporangium sp. AC04546]|uniref:sugar ABC transporter ATP-binding protein n=1 Tax=Dactylosporangium sp. AC04546 TaxID=2862460 RepID=UPI001EDD4510|nr:sugar ABC transporter ATP-binding protein [Dactylosporangium sp. AC04546]WVK79225.1 sugar ABC transporter ATP-binding protein [Dactylosporangium sp. AC04546]
MTALLRVSGASKRFPGVQALDGVDLELRHGEVLALVGENGAGKSTLMKLLSGIDRPDEGEFFLDGSQYTPGSPRHAQELGISIIHQELNLMADLTVAQNIFIGREPRVGGFVLSERALNRRTRELLARLGLPLEPTDLVGDLTVARQQMVEIAKALSFNARVLVMDEPTAALNETEVDTLFGLIRRFVTPSTGVIYISHRMHELAQITDRITVLRDGRHVGTLDTATSSVPEVISLMVGREITGEQRPRGAVTTGEPVLSVRGLRTRALLRDVSFEVRRGEILGFAGLMGAGRTEVARAIVGADRRDGGTVAVHGREVAIASPADAARAGIGYLSEDRKHFGVLLGRSVRDNVVLASMPRFTSPLGFVADRLIGRTATDYVARLRIRTPSTGQLVQHLSGGNQQKTVVAKWLVRDCDVLIFDEPTRGIDVGAKDEIYALLDELAAAGKAIVMISSELPEVLRMSHRIAVMCQGRITAILDNTDATQENIMDYATRFNTEGAEGTVTR